RRAAHREAEGRAGDPVVRGDDAQLRHRARRAVHRDRAPPQADGLAGDQPLPPRRRPRRRRRLAEAGALGRHRRRSAARARARLRARPARRPAVRAGAARPRGTFAHRRGGERGAVSTVGERAARIGCSGWNYAHWRNGVFYPPRCPARLWLQFYARQFDTVEINTTFYRLPRRDAVARWVEETPDDFVFAVKVSRYVTHIKRLLDVPRHLPLLYERIEPLRPKLGPLLWQL